MWDGHVDALFAYQVEICGEWTRRGYVDNCLAQSAEIHEQLVDLTDEHRLPAWFGDERFHASHRSNLLRKAPEHYGNFGWAEPDDLPYFWPTKA